MKSEWKKCKIGELGDVITGKTPPTKHDEYWNGCIPFVTPVDLQQTKHILSTERYITKLGKEKVKSSILPKNSVCVSCIGNIGYLGVTIEESISNQQINSVVVNDNNDSEFVYYLLKSLWKYFKNYEGQSTTVSILNKSQFSRIEVNVPPLPTQKKIAAILSALDAKIENNNAINRNLEQQAQAIFKSWFVDFEPFGGKMPEGWRVGKVGELGNIVGGSTPPKTRKEYYSENGIPWITPKDLAKNKNKFISRGETDISELGLKNSGVVTMPKGTILFSSRAPIGYIAISRNEVTTNQGFKSVVPFEGFGTEYIYFFLKNNITTIENMSSGSTFAEISGSSMRSVPVLVPDECALKEFSRKAKSIFDLQLCREQENTRLAALRDTLLPKLMSGEIEV